MCDGKLCSPGLFSSVDSFLLCSLCLYFVLLYSPGPVFFRGILHRVQIFPCKLFFLFLWVLLFIFNFFRILDLHRILQIVLILYGNWVFKTRYLCGIIVSNSASRKRVFKPRVLYGTRVSKTWDVNLLKPFKRVLTYYIQSPYYANLQISPVFNHHDAWHGVWGWATISWWIVLYVWWEGVKGVLWYQTPTLGVDGSL